MIKENEENFEYSEKLSELANEIKCWYDFEAKLWGITGELQKNKQHS